MRRWLEIALLGVLLGACVAFVATGCRTARPYKEPTTEAEVRETYPSCRVVRDVDAQGHTRLVVFLRPRPAAPRGGMLVYEVAGDGTVRCVRTIISQ